MEEKWSTYNDTPFFKKWASMAPLYQDYGDYLISIYPSLYLKHFVWPNLLRYYAPPAGFMGQYNMSYKTVEPTAVSWFDWTNNQLPKRINHSEIKIIRIFPNLVAIINPLFFLSSTIFLLFGGIRRCSKLSNNIIGCMLIVWYGNAIFSIFSAPVELRYQIFPVIITLPFMVFFISWIIKTLKSAPTGKSKQKILLTEPAM
jgi:hypothetical protein